jgi:hypothetical protein
MLIQVDEQSAFDPDKIAYAEEYYSEHAEDTRTIVSFQGVKESKYFNMPLHEFLERIEDAKRKYWESQPPGYVKRYVDPDNLAYKDLH